MSDRDQAGVLLPQQPIDRLIAPIERFLHVEAASGIVLLSCTVVALVLANSGWSEGFLGLWNTKVGIQLGSVELMHSLQHWINDGAMAIFFFVIGLEVKREIVLGELRDARKAALPLAAALGGMIVPAGLYLALQHGKAGQSGWGISMATDIAFVVGCMAVLGPRIPPSFRVMILSLAIVDDIGAILVIAIGYSESINLIALGLGFAGVILVPGMWRLGIRNPLVHGAVGIGVWLAFHESGVHATIAGVLLGLVTPTSAHVSSGVFMQGIRRVGEIFRGEGWANTAHRAAKVRVMKKFARESISPVEYLEGALHPWVSFVIMPLFALANAGVPFVVSDVLDPVALTIVVSLTIGKPIGIVGASWIAVRAGIASLPQGVSWPVLVGGGLLAGIGFTMALFIAGLALEGPLLATAKVGVLGASVIAGVAGMSLLLIVLPRPGDSTSREEPT